MSSTEVDELESSSSANLVPSKRDRKQTEKGKQFQVQLLEDERLSAQRSWRKQLNRVENYLADETEPGKLQGERIFLESTMEILLSAHERLVEALDDLATKRVAQEKFEKMELEHSDMLKRLNQKITDLKQEKESAMSSLTAASSRRSKASNTRSAKSRSSRSSRSSAVIDRKADTAVRVAKLKTELYFADDEATKVAELRKFRLTKKLALVEAEMKAIDEVEESEFSDENKFTPPVDINTINKYELVRNYLRSQASSRTEDSISTVETYISCKSKIVPSKSFSKIVPSNQHKQTDQKIEIPEEPGNPAAQYPSTLNPHAHDYFTSSTPKNVQPSTRPIESSSVHFQDPKPKGMIYPQDEREITQPQTSGDVLERLADLMTQRHARELLPLPEPEMFSGDLLHYPTWKKSFDTIVERRTDSSSQRLYYLGRYTTGEAKESVSGLLALDSEDAYLEARKILSDRFGNPYLVANAYKKKIKEWPNVPPNDGISLRKFSDLLVHCQAAMTEIHYLQALNDPEENQKLVRKLPRNICDRWGREVDQWLNRKETDCQNARSKEPAYPPFSVFCDFLKREARIACNPVAMSRVIGEERKVQPPRDQRSGWSNRNKPFDARALTTGSEEVRVERKSDKRPPERCRLCKSAHSLDDCGKFAKMSYAEKLEVVKSNGLCLGCLRYGHMKRDCRGKKVCATCKGFHPTSLHHTTPRAPQQTERPKRPLGSTEEVMITSHRVSTQDTQNRNACDSHSLIVPVWVHHEAKPERKELVYALLDNQSDACFIRDDILQKLNISGPDVQLKLSTVLGEDLVTSKKINDLVVRGINEEIEVSLPRTYSRDEIPAKRSQIARPESVSGWSHLQRIANYLMPYQHDVDVGLLIGANCTKAIKPREVIPGTDDDPYAVRTTLGWGVIGIMNCTTAKSQENHCFCNRIVSREIDCNQTKLKTISHLVARTQAKKVFAPAQLSKMLERDFSETSREDHALSFLDKKFLNVLESNIQHQDDGHYEMPLPLKEEGLKLPNNRSLALSCLERLKQRLKRDRRYRDHYEAFMKEMIDKGQAERVPDDELQLTNGRVWYIPHHGVYHPQKPDKIRIVFDASAEFKGDSLNRHLLQGPDLTNSLNGVLCRFRKEPIAFTCDVEGMFHQVFVNPEYRNLLRFLWWDNGNVDSTPTEHRMTVHLFGATSSPGCANFTLKRTADDFEELFGSEPATFVKKDFYVDDGLKSVPSATEASALIKSTKSLLAKGGFNLHKFISNSKEVIEAIPKEQRASGIKELDLSRDILPIERALGVQWCVQSDALQFRVVLKDKPLTRRGILASISSIYDPLGLAAPFLLQGKQILQDLYKNQAAWDAMVPDEIKARWEKWRGELHALAELKICRCYKPDNFGHVRAVELHSFSDASVSGYGQSSYLRMINDRDEVHCALVMAKSRVTPLKPVTVPRLELTAAVVSTKISSFLQKELNYQDMQEFFWTDSRVVLGYISNEARRFHTFVANRVQAIRDHACPEQWRYVDTKDNPADDASRGLGANELIRSERWWNGRNFLWKPLPNETNFDPQVSPGDPEVRKVIVLASTSAEHSDLTDDIKHFSDWFHAKRVIALCVLFSQKMKLSLKKDSTNSVKEEDSLRPSKERKRQDESLKSVTLRVKDLQTAELFLIKASQSKAFPEEIEALATSHIKRMGY